jgi:hypothetical protein
VQAYLTGVVDAESSRLAIALVLLVDGLERWPDGGLDARFADDRLLEQWLEPVTSTGASTFVDVVDLDADGFPRERLADAAAWAVWTCAAVSLPLERLVCAARLGISRARERVAVPLLHLDELRATVRRASRSFAGAEVECEATVVSFGVPGTPVGLVMAHALASLAARGCPTSAARLPSSDEMHALAAAGAKIGALDLLRVASMPPAREGDDLTSAILAQLRTTALGEVVSRLEGSGERRAPLVLRSLAWEARGILEARTGDYEAIERALARVCDDPPALIDEVLGEDPYSLASALVSRAHVANHRGAVLVAQDAVARAMVALARERSMRATVLTLEAATLNAVAAQNRWPFAPSDTESGAAMGDAMRGLESAIGLFSKKTSAEPDTSCDPTLGAALGTLGRTHAFLGEHDLAERTLLAARAHFTAASDLRMNATFLFLVELDRGAEASAAKVAGFLDLISEPEARSPEHAVAALTGGDAGWRFSLDLILRSLVAGIELPGIDPARWAMALCEHGVDSLFALLGAAPTHPTELCARHAGEWLRAQGHVPEGDAWLDLAIAVPAAPDSTLLRLRESSTLLRSGGALDPTAPHGSIPNPSYEYR